MAAKPDEVSAEVWLLCLALSSLVPAALYMATTWRLLERVKHSRQDSDEAAAVGYALCVRNAYSIKVFLRLLDGLESHPLLGQPATFCVWSDARHVCQACTQHKCLFESA